MTDTDILDDARRRLLRAEYVGRINRVIDHIEANLAWRAVSQTRHAGCWGTR
jgi:hypothetical protein